MIETASPPKYMLSTRYYDTAITPVDAAFRRSLKYEPGLVEFHDTWAAAHESLLDRLRERVRWHSVLLDIEQRQLARAEKMQPPTGPELGPEWISLAETEPAAGQAIVARYADKQWGEVWTPGEPRGLLTHWRAR